MKRFISLLLTLLMALTLLPAAAWAEETAPADVQQEETSAVLRQADGGAAVYMVDTADGADTGIAAYAAGDDLDTQLKAAGFVAPEMGTSDNWETPGIFFISAPVGLEEGTDYTYTYEDGHLTLKLLPGVASHWKAALLNCVTSDELGDTLKFNVEVERTSNTDFGSARSCSKMTEYIASFIGGNYGTMHPFDYSTGFWFDFDVATPVLDGDNTDICVQAGAEDIYYLVVWQHEDGSYTKYALRITVDGGEGFQYTVATPKLRDLAADRFQVNNGIEGGETSWSIVKAPGQLSLMPQAGKALSELTKELRHNYYDIGTFNVTSPGDNYTLQSYYIINQTNYSIRQNDFPSTVPDNIQLWELEIFTSDNKMGSTLRFTLRWANADPTQPDIVEKLNVRVSPRPWGKLSSDSTGDPNILDVAYLYNYILLEQKPITDVDKVDPQLAAYDLNYDGYVDVYDIQTLYEYVVQSATPTN